MAATEKGQGEGPQFSEQQLLIFSWVTAIFAAIGALSLFVWMFAGPPGELDIRSRAVLPVVTVGLALVTFITFMYRSAVISRQADEQKRSNDSADRVERTGVFQKGAEMTMASDVATIRAGVESLAVLAAQPDMEYSTASWQILERLWTKCISEKRYDLINSIGPAIAMAGRHRPEPLAPRAAVARPDTTFDTPEIEWQDGLPNLTYADLYFVLKTPADLRRYVFQRCAFRRDAYTREPIELDVYILMSN